VSDLTREDIVAWPTGTYPDVNTFGYPVGPLPPNVPPAPVPTDPDEGGGFATVNIAGLKVTVIVNGYTPFVEATFDWGDGTTKNESTNGQGNTVAARTYKDPGSYLITVTNKDTGEPLGSHEVTLEAEPKS
jgi:hypothetical protein